MARVFITGSSDGLGQMAAQLLVKQGNAVVLHARHERRAKEALAAVPGAETCVVGDLSSLAETRQVAEQVNALGTFDAVIHNAALGYKEYARGNTVDGLPPVFAVNSLAPYVLTCLITPPQRLIYISSGLHNNGDISLQDLTLDTKRWNGFQAYSDSKFHNVLLAFAVARKWPNVYSNALEPGWVATKMGGPTAPDSLEKAPETQVWLASSQEPEALVTGKYFYHKKLRGFHSAAANPELQEQYLATCAEISGISFPMA